MYVFLCKYLYIVYFLFNFILLFYLYTSKGASCKKKSSQFIRNFCFCYNSLFVWKFIKIFLFLFLYSIKKKNRFFEHNFFFLYDFFYSNSLCNGKMQQTLIQLKYNIWWFCCVFFGDNSVIFFFFLKKLFSLFVVVLFLLLL